MMLFNPDDYPHSPDAVTAWRIAETELSRLRLEDAADEALIAAAEEDTLLVGHPADEDHPERADDCPWCRIEARAPRRRELEGQVEELARAALLMTTKEASR